MNQHDFDILLQKYLSGECDPEEEKQILEWSETAFANGTMTISRSEQIVVERRMWKRISSSVLGKSPMLKRIGWRWLAVAATIILVSGLAIFVPDSISKLNQNIISKISSSDADLALEDYAEVYNTTGKPKTLSLEDGTIVTLTPESSLKYSRHFDNKKRQVELEGEAFFEVKKDSSRPFFVYTGELVTQVLGTTFNVKSYKDSKIIEVKVVSGRVSVYENKQKAPQNRNGVILRPNQKITFDKESKKLVPELVEAPVLQDLQEKKLEFVFEESTLQEVLSVIQKAFGVEIVVEKSTLNDCIFTGDLTGLPLHTQLRFICKSVNASYELRGTTFFIKGDGCKK
ncbi:FecR family protein [Dyadobacter chenwenxiniae]|uniref:FecR family protein n=1 Tax=Dyadobacter chenwenxiniae TaxID=2906456 RepID=A0A9X1PJ56_9BACT|nr:FecR family protein [Dyadobacter chenwenxiniae]MCF0053441.1 FecR family protein [Dyadobacter chenwenxiniae]MCF0060438.1 FecR family protein [Dyadobacter chenwenxiniae]UON86169.1 FecR family protein [Dyadobacter chenwenxiniae]